MSIVKAAYDNQKQINAKLLVRGDKDAIIKTQITTMKEVIEGRTN